MLILNPLFTHKNTLREISKFTSGLVLGDFLCGTWLYLGGYLPMTFWGLTFDARMVAGGMVFDALLFALLIHYGWRMADRSRSSKEKTFHKF
ncbi:hypothetical protein COT93_02345 [Candidatus Falkowbacteria bacterium CG10_big_fil_rev_8_21_14_0_10_37_18]|uniref:Uncharacterized protein n=1 Tax=Candidatus Falkowbacteria bacterium CG10_big_fil_rev_8_21_14_0_10_37_18 TaxID=1974562 RepID=A0A2H0VAP6_9BACT|nr:MAG: hypothetical protein COT93_02345 [Candidatus Falkowbacteria bacterium CG10_big_fil_rev_8_21_14_0_10_37_18]